MPAEELEPEIIIGGYLDRARASAHGPRDAARDRDRLARVLDATVTNPWVTLDRMADGDTPAPAWKPFDRGAALDRLSAPTGGNVSLGANADGIEGRLYTHDGLDAQVYVALRRFGVDGARHASALLERIMEHMPNGAFGAVHHSQLMDPDDLALCLPKPFNGCPWLAALTPFATEAQFDRAALLATPAVAVREDQRGTIWLQIYDEPLDFDAPAAVRRREAVRSHLFAHAKLPVAR